MASTTKIAPQKEEVPEKEGADTPPDSPLLDLSDVAVRKLIRNAKKRGYVRVDQINSVLPSKEVNSERIEDVLAMFSEMGVNVVQTGVAEPEEEGGEEPDEETEAEANELVEAQQEVPAKAEAKIPTQRPEDPVGIYMLAMRSIKLLSRAGEIAIAKRIEAGREAMIAGLCESPLTFRAIIVWRDELNEGKVLLRDIIDLEATYAGPDAKAVPSPVIGLDGQPLVAGTPVPGQPPQTHAPATDAPTPFKPAVATDGDGEQPSEGALGEGETDEEDLEGSLSIVAIEAALKPKVLETLDTVAGTYKRLRRLQELDIHFHLKGASLSSAQKRKYKKLKKEIIAEV